MAGARRRGPAQAGGGAEASRPQRAGARRARAAADVAARALARDGHSTAWSVSDTTDESDRDAARSTWLGRAVSRPSAGSRRLLRRRRRRRALPGGAPAREVDKAAMHSSSRRCSTTTRPIGEIYRGDPDAGRRLALQAVAVDPMNPLFLQTEGFALAHLRQPRRRPGGTAAPWRPTRRCFPPGTTSASCSPARAATTTRCRHFGGRSGRATTTPTPGSTSASCSSAAGCCNSPAAQGALGRAFRARCRPRQGRAPADHRRAPVLHQPRPVQAAAAASGTSPPRSRSRRCRPWAWRCCCCSACRGREPPAGAG